MKRAIGSAYLINQTAGSERLGGLQVVVRRKTGPVGRVIINPTDWRSDEVHTGIDTYVEHAIAGLNEMAKEMQFSLAEVDIELRGFLVHDVDSHPRCYHQAGRSAFRSAIEMGYL